MCCALIIKLLGLDDVFQIKFVFKYLQFECILIIVKDVQKRKIN